METKLRKKWIQGYEEKSPMNVTLFTHVHRQGKAISLYAGKDMAEAFQIRAGDKLEVQIKRHWTPIRTEQIEPVKREKQ